MSVPDQVLGPAICVDALGGVVDETDKESWVCWRIVEQSLACEESADQNLGPSGGESEVQLAVEIGEMARRILRRHHLRERMAVCQTRDAAF